MPINIDGKTFEDFDSAVEHVKRTKPGIKSPEGYVATVERKMKGAKAQRLYARLDKVMESMSDYKSVIDSFKRGESAYGGNYHSDGSTLSLYGHPIAKHNGDKMSVSDAGYPTHTTHKALRHLGVDIKRKGGQTHIHGKPYKSGEFVDVPKSKLAQMTPGHDNATRGATDEEQKLIDAARKKKDEKQKTAAGYNICKDCDYQAKDYDDLLEHGKSNDHTIMSKKAQLEARLQKLAGTTPMKDGGPCPQCTGKGKDYRANCPTCEGTGRQMFPYSE